VLGVLPPFQGFYGINYFVMLFSSTINTNKKVNHSKIHLDWPPGKKRRERVKNPF
jgi:hypothetical protein